MSATTRDQEEQDLRIEQMTVDIEKMRQEMRRDSHRFVLQVLAAGAGCLLAGAAIATLLFRMSGLLP